MLVDDSAHQLGSFVGACNGDELGAAAGECFAEGFETSQFVDRQWVVDGEEKAFMELIGGGRTREYGCDAGEPWAKLIHGSIYLTEGMKIRKAIIDTHRDLFESEYINDLESVIEGLKKQIINLEKRYGIN